MENKNNYDITKFNKKLLIKNGRTDIEKEYAPNEIIDIKNIKIKFKRSAKNYKLSKNYKLLYKTKIKKYNNKTNLYDFSYDYLQLPTVKDLNNYLYEFHCHNFHCNEKDLIQLFKDNKINFYGLQSIVQDYVYNCPICTQTTKTIHREEPEKQFLLKGQIRGINSTSLA